MSTAVICAGCGTVMERYEDSGPYVERPEGLCSKCFGDGAAFDRAFDAWEAGRDDGWAES